MADGTHKLCLALYGHGGAPRDWCGGADAKMLYDAAERIARLKRDRDEAQDLICRITDALQCGEEPPDEFASHLTAQLAEAEAKGVEQAAAYVDGVCGGVYTWLAANIRRLAQPEGE